MVTESYHVTASILATLHYLLAAFAVFLCVLLYRRTRIIVWLLLACLMLKPYFGLASCLVHGWPVAPFRLAPYESVVREFPPLWSWALGPVIYGAAIAGLFWYLRREEREQKV